MILRLPGRTGAIEYELGEPQQDSAGRVYLPLTNRISGRGDASLTLTVEEIAKISSIRQKPGRRK
jgi:hypothetical protein